MGSLKVEVVFALPDRVDVVALELPPGATVADALRACGLTPIPHAVGIFGQKVKPAAVLADGDRVEIYRPLELDPKEARRRRALGKR